MARYVDARILHPGEDLYDLLSTEPDGAGPETDCGSPEALERRMRRLERRGPFAQVDGEAAALLRAAGEEGWDAERLATQVVERVATLAEEGTLKGLVALIGREPSVGAVAHRSISRLLIDRGSRRR